MYFGGWWVGGDAGCKVRYWLDLSKLHCQKQKMIPPLDPKTKQFYLEMGYSEQQIRQAFETAKNLGVDFVDALTMQQDATLPLSPPKTSEPSAKNVSTRTKSQNNYPLLTSFTYKSSTTFMTPLLKIKLSDYQIFFSKSSKLQQVQSKLQLREEDYPVGLLNVSNCCYLNSLLQCYFLMNAFKTAILTSEPLPNLEQALANESKTKVKRIISEYQLLTQLKLFFTTMALTSKKYVDPTFVLQNLVDSVGEKISYGEEKDLSEINILIIQRLSEGLMHSKDHYQSLHQESLLDMNFKEGSTILEPESKQPYSSIFNPRQGAIKKLFYGTKVEYYDDPAMQKELPIVSDFTGLILNPRAGNLYMALDEQFNFQVQINGGLHKKTAFIRDQPDYLFLYINRTDYDREEGQALKTEHKFTFDFGLYLDRYLEKYRKEHSHSHEKIKELLATKNKLKEQVSFLQILFKKIEECGKYAQQLEGWAAKLPKEEEFEEEFKRLEEKLERVEKQLDQIESRKEQYHLMYIFVHRGDAVSGHYWGYGRNDGNWYRFDINTSLIQQDQIVIDLQKSAAIPYALLYVKEANIPNFDYKLHLDNSILKQQFPKGDFRACFDAKIASDVILENKRLHQEAIDRSNRNIKGKTFNDYSNRFNLLKKIQKKYDEERQLNKSVGQLEIVNNFSLYLWTKDQHQLSKFTLFEQALLTASGNKLTVQRLMQQPDLLPKIQKKFKKSCHGQQCLKFYSLLPKQIQKYCLLYQEYQINSFEVIWACVILSEAEFYQDEWSIEVTKNGGSMFQPPSFLKNRILRLLKLIRLRKNLYKNELFQKAMKSLPEPLYISQINNEIVKLLMLSIVAAGLKIDSLQQFANVSDQIGAQLTIINAQNNFFFEHKSLVQEKSSPIEDARDFVCNFHANISKKSKKGPSTAGESTLENKDRKISSSVSGFKNNFLASPGKSAKKIEIKEKNVEQLLVSNSRQILMLQAKEFWKSEQLQSMKINYELGPKLLNFLRKLDPLPRIYKKVIKQDKALSVVELRKEGLLVNQKPSELTYESLI